MLSVQCPNCNASLSIDEKYAGQSGTCNMCGTSLVVPFGPQILETTHIAVDERPRVAKKRSVFFVLAAIFVVLAILTLSGFARYFYRAGTGHAFLEFMQSENLPWDSMTDARRAPYLARARAEGFKCAVLMVLGQYIPGCLLVLITIGLLTRSISHTRRVFLRFAFWGVWVLGTFFLALGSGYWGQAIPFPQSLAPAFILYLVAAMLFGFILGLFWAGRKVQSWYNAEFREALAPSHAE